MSNITKMWISYAESLFNYVKKGTPYTDTLCNRCPYDHHCCDYTVSVTIFEAQALVDHIKETFTAPDKFFEKIKQRAEETGKFFKKYPSLYAGSKDWADEDKKCVFYDHFSKRCSIYEVRPFYCRTFYSVNDCFQNKGLSLREEKSLTIKRNSYMTSDSVKGEIYELCDTITKLNEDDNAEMSDEFKGIMDSFSKS